MKKACKAYGVKAHNSTQVLPLSLLNISAFTIHLKLEEIIVTEKALPYEMGTELEKIKREHVLEFGFPQSTIYLCHLS